MCIPIPIHPRAMTPRAPQTFRVMRRVGKAQRSTSLVIHPPLPWARAAGVRPGSTVEFVFGLGGLLLVVPRGREGEAGRLLRLAVEMV
jgi:hypothetical protein